MLSRYHMKRGTRKELLPQGIRQDTRKHTRHILRPDKALVQKYLGMPSSEAWTAFRQEYSQELARRYNEQSEQFEALAELARNDNVYLGCSCPTKSNPDIRHCHTWLALEFMQAKFPSLQIVFPEK